MKLPLDGVRIVAVEQYGAGPFGTQHLADLGAEVIKIENPTDSGDVGRMVGPYFFALGDSHFHQSFNRNKKSITLDLKTEGGKAVWTCPVSTDGYRLESQAGLGSGSVTGSAGLSTGGVAPATQSPTVVNPCSTLDGGRRAAAS